MRSAVLFFFSGSGNTELVTRLIQAELEQHGVAATRAPLDCVGAPNLEPHDTVFLGFPVHGFGIPVPVRSFIERMPPSTGKRAVVFCTYGGFSGGAEKWAARLLALKGLTPIGTMCFRMPHNNPPGVDLSTQPVEALVDAAGRKIRTALARLVHASDPIDLCSPARALVSSWLNPLSLNYKLLDFSYSRRAYADESCNRCLRCVRSCPTGSICLTEASIRFAESCCSCLRCYYGCPRAAIQTSERTEGKPRYRGPLGDYELPVTREAHRNDDRGPKDASQSDQQRCSAGV